MHASLWPEPNHMRIRDTLKKSAQCEREGIAAQTYTNNAPVIVKDGGDGEDITPFMRETRRRTVRIEDRLAIIMRLLIGLFITIVGGIAGGVVLAVLL